MKVKLYRKFVRFVCKSLKISKQQLFSRDFSEKILYVYGFNLATKSVARDYSKLNILHHRNPLSQIWNAFCFHERWLFKYWKYCHLKYFIQMKIDLGLKEDDIIVDLLKKMKR